MAGKKSKSIFRQPGARKFQLVHRSQRDPLIHDPEASTHVLKPIGGYGSSSKERERDDQERANAGEATLYGVYYDDSDYDYMQHLRPVGLYEDGVESVWIDAPAPQASAKGKGKLKDQSFLRKGQGDGLTSDLPPEALPSRFEMSRAEAQDAKDSAIPEALRGLQPDMDPHLRQALEALEDDAFVVAEVEGVPENLGGKQRPRSSALRGSDEEREDVLDDADDFFADLVADGEREEDVEAPWEFREEGYEEGEDGSESLVEQDDSWEARFKKFKNSQQKNAEDEGASDIDLHDDGGRSEAMDTVGTLPKLPVIGGKRRRKGASDASGYSMSSSSMFRNDGLTLLDEKFDQIEKDYDSDNTIPDDEDDDDSAPELLTSRDDFNDIMDDFLDKYEVFGGKMHGVLPGETPADKLGTLRQGLRDEQGLPIKVQNLVESDDDDDNFDIEEYLGFKKDDEGDKWDCETILSEHIATFKKAPPFCNLTHVGTYSNLANHPKLVRAIRSKSVAKIIIDPKTGLPSTALQEPIPKSKKSRSQRNKPFEFIGEDAGIPPEPKRVTVTRSKEESKEDKKARKQSVKDERQTRRLSKKANTAEFENERRHQLQVLASGPTRGVRKL